MQPVQVALEALVCYSFPSQSRLREILEERKKLILIPTENKFYFLPAWTQFCCELSGIILFESIECRLHFGDVRFHVDFVE